MFREGTGAERVLAAASSPGVLPLAWETVSRERGEEKSAFWLCVPTLGSSEEPKPVPP